MDIVDKLRSQVGDDVQHIFCHEALFRSAADEIEVLRRERDEARDLLKGMAKNIGAFLTDPNAPSKEPKA